MLLLDDTLFFRSRRFRWLRYLVAASVPAFYFGRFFYTIVVEAYYVSQHGAIVRSADFVFGRDNLIMALVTAAILISELEVVAKPKTYLMLRLVCIIIGVIAMLSGCIFLLEMTHMFDYRYFETAIAAHIMLQISVFFAAIYLYNRIILRTPEADIPHA